MAITLHSLLMILAIIHGLDMIIALTFWKVRQPEKHKLARSIAIGGCFLSISAGLYYARPILVVLGTVLGTVAVGLLMYGLVQAVKELQEAKTQLQEIE